MRLPFALALLGLVPAAPLAAAPQPNAEMARQAGDLLERRYPADGPGGAVLVARGDQVLFRGARGEADVARHVRLRPDSVFRIASVTKQFVAAGLLKLVESGKVGLDDPLSRYLPDYPGGERILVRQLLNHSSGLASTSATPPSGDVDTAGMIASFRDETPTSAPGAKWEYNNFGYMLIGAVIEAASGEPWHAYLKRALFRPLGMKHTGYALDPKLAARQVHGHSHEDGKIVPAQPINMTHVHAAGALVSNVDDLLKWNRALHEGRVIGRPLYSRMIDPEGSATDVGYGYGLFNDRVRTVRMLRHGGAISGFMSSLSYVPGPDISVVVLENDDGADGESAEALSRRLAAIALGDPYPELSAVPVDPSALKSAEGTYRFAGDVTRILRVVGGRLTSKRGSRGEPQPLTPIGRDDFLYPDGFNRLKLERDAAGRVTGALYFPRGDGAGERGLRSAGPVEPAGVQLPLAALERVSGSYGNGRLTLKVFREGGALLAQIAGQPPVSLRATAPDRFDVEETGASVEFAGGEGPAGEVTLRQNGRELVLKRLP